MQSPASFSRRHFLRTLAGLSLAAPAAARGAEESAELEIQVDPQGWGAAGPAKIRTVLHAAAGEIWRWCPGGRMRPMRVSHRDDFPQTDFVHDLRGRIRIGLAVDDAHWAQLAFQFAHEFTHALAQHSAAARRAWRTPRHANLWFEESLCETASLFVLRRLVARGVAAPSEFARYASERLARPEHRLPPGRSFADWFRENEPRLRENHALRAKNVIVARQMLPILEADPAAWEAACYLNLGRRDHAKSRAQYFAEWQAASPPRHRAFLVRVAALFAESA